SSDQGCAVGTIDRSRRQRLSRDQQRRDLKDGPIAVRAASKCGAVQVTVRVEDHVADRFGPVAAGEVVEIGVHPAAIGRYKLKNRTISISTVSVGRAVQITRIVHSQAGLRATSG